MAGMIGRGRGITVDTLEDNPLPGIALMQQDQLRAASPILDNLKSEALNSGETAETPKTAASMPLTIPPQSPGQFEEAAPAMQHQTQDAAVTEPAPVPDSSEQQPAVPGKTVQSTAPHAAGDPLPKPDDSPPTEDSTQPVEHAQQKKPLSPGLLPYQQMIAEQSPDDAPKYTRQSNKHTKKEHYGERENYGKGDGGFQNKQYQGGNYNKPKHRQSPHENQSMPHGANRKSYVPPQFQQNQQQSEMQQLYIKEQQLKDQKFQLHQMQHVQQEDMKSMSPQQQEELLNRQAQLEKLQDNQIRLVQVQQKHLQLKNMQPQTEEQYVQKQQKMRQLEEEQARLQQIQMQFMEHREQQRMMEEQQRLAKEQVSEFFQSQSMSPEQILQQFGSQGVIGGRGKRLEELTKHVQARQPGPNGQRPHGNKMPQPGYMIKEEMGRNRLGSQEDHHRQSPYETTDGSSHQYHPGSMGKRRTPPPPPNQSPRGPPPPDGNPPIPSGSSMGLDEIALPPGVPTHLPPPPLAVGLLDQMGLGGGYGGSDMGAFTGTSAQGQYNYPPFPQVKGEVQGMYNPYNKKGPIKSVHQVGQNQHQKPHKGQKGQAGGYKKQQKPQQQQGTPATQKQQQATPATQKQQKQQQATPATPPKGPLSNEEQKNEYEWQKFKIVRKVKKALDGMKEGEEEETANEIIKVLKEESERLANYPWPKEQYVALAEVFTKAVESCKEDIHKQMIKLLMILHKLHPKNMCTDLKKVIIDKHQMFIKVSPATNAKKLYESCVSFLLELHSAAGKAEEQPEFKESMSKFVLTLITKWTAYDAEDTELGEVYTYCLMAFFREFAPLMDEEMDKKFYGIIRENQLRGKNRAMREGLLDLLLFQNTGWKTEPTRPEKPAEEDTEKVAEEEKSVAEEERSVAAEADKTSVDSNSIDSAVKQEQIDSNEENIAKTHPDQETMSEFDLVEQRVKDLQAQATPDIETDGARSDLSRDAETQVSTITHDGSGDSVEQNTLIGASDTDEDKVRKKVCAFLLSDMMKHKSSDIKVAQDECEPEESSGWNPHLLDDGYVENTDWADDPRGDGRVDDMRSAEDLGGDGYGPGTDGGYDPGVDDRSTTRGHHGQQVSPRLMDTNLNITVYQGGQSSRPERKVHVNSSPYMGGFGYTPRMPSTPRYDYGVEGTMERSELDNLEYYVSRRSSESYDDYDISPRDDNITSPRDEVGSSHSSDWYDEQIDPMRIRHTYAGPPPSVKSSVPLGARGSRKMVRNVAQTGPRRLRCALCGNYDHDSMECPIVKQYAPNLYQEPAKRDPSERDKRPKQESQFGKKMYCSHCGRKGHMNYHCPERMTKPYNFFKHSGYDYD